MQIGFSLKESNKIKLEFQQLLKLMYCNVQPGGGWWRVQMEGAALSSVYTVCIAMARHTQLLAV